MKIRFTKMQGLGNDFVVLDAINQAFVPNAREARFLADRHFGVGCDQILVVEASRRPDADFRYRIFNADGGEVEQCGNGARCFVRFAIDSGLTTGRELRVDTASGLITPRLEEDGQVTVDMGAPRFRAAEIPFIGNDDIIQPLHLGGRVCDITAVSMGNPHCVQVVDDVDAFPVAAVGPLIEAHERFPRRANAGFMQVTDRHAIRLRVYERGAGETLACGTGACAAVAAGIRRGLLDSPVRVTTRGGDLLVAGGGGGQPVFMTGPAGAVFTGEIDLPEDLK